MADPVGDIIGDYQAFAAQQRDRLLARGIDIRPYALSHLAVRVPEWDQYVHVRTLLERHANASAENVWNGRPISMILLATPLEVLDGMSVPLIELIPGSTSASTRWASSTSEWSSATKWRPSLGSTAPR
jgi:predicted metalloenzyme YecM